MSDIDRREFREMLLAIGAYWALCSIALVAGAMVI